MDMAQLDRARAQERKYDRRAARTRRSKWLGRLLFSLTGMGLLLLLRMNPAVVSDVIAWSQDTQRPQDPRVIAKPDDIHVRAMPSNSVPVRHGGTLPGHGTGAPRTDKQAQAETLGAMLRSLDPGN